MYLVDAHHCSKKRGNIGFYEMHLWGCGAELRFFGGFGQWMHIVPLSHLPAQISDESCYTWDWNDSLVETCQRSHIMR
jgi:hypothetical protein